jgi:alpha-galactosidase
LCRSDTAGRPGRADWDQTQTQGLSLFIPVFASFAWSPDAYVMRSAATAGVTCQFGYLDKDFPMQDAKAALLEAGENRKYWYGDFYPLLPATMASDQWAAYQFHRADLNAGIVLAFRRNECSIPTVAVNLGGIDPAATYEVESIDETRQISRQTLSGRQLGRQYELHLAEKASSLLIRYRKVP